MYTLSNYPSVELASSIQLWTDFGVGAQAKEHVQKLK